MCYYLFVLPVVFFVYAFKMKVVVPLNDMHANGITFKVEKSNKKSSKNIKNLK